MHITSMLGDGKGAEQICSSGTSRPFLSDQGEALPGTDVPRMSRKGC